LKAPLSRLWGSVRVGMGKRSAYRVELEQRARELGCELEWIGSGTWAVVGDDSGNTIRRDGRGVTYHTNLEMVERCLGRVEQRRASACAWREHSAQECSYRA
jgi:hypothetical protein